MYFIFDCETTGFPIKNNGRQFGDPKISVLYDTSRLVSISWIIADKNLEILEKSTYIIKPDRFIIPEVVIKIHGITNEIAHSKGVPIRKVLDALSHKIECFDTIVAHNIVFDINIFSSECYRYGYDMLAEKFIHSTRYCTMLESRRILTLRKNPKLSELYKLLYDDEMMNAHDAEYDTWYCFECFRSLKNKTDQLQASETTMRVHATEPVKQSCPEFTMDGKKILLNPAQSRVVFDDIDAKSTLIVSVAGSGKTTTVVCRIKYLIDNGVAESSIILTTFTRDAAADMENKLLGVCGYVPNINIGTIDALALRYVSSYHPELIDGNTNIGEYGIEFLKLLKSARGKDILANIKYFFIDEFQDINDTQYKIIKQFYNSGAKITAIGDDAQNIYTFRGSDIKYILNFKNYFGDSTIHTLSTNYRSTADLIAFANATMEKNTLQIPKVMSARDPHPTGIRPKVHFFNKLDEQYTFINDKISEYMRGGYASHQIAVLCPQNSYLYGLEELLTKNKIPNLLLDSKNDVKSKIVPDHVCLSTIHKSKGLEWDIVFLLMMNDEIFPSKKEEKDIYESRRLFYVGVTRSKCILHMSYSIINSCKYVCRFITEVDPELYEFYNFSPDCLGYSQKSFVSNNFSIPYLIRSLDGEDYVSLKDSGILPEISPIEINLYEGYKYPEFVTDNNIHGDFLSSQIQILAAKTFRQISV